MSENVIKLETSTIPEMYCKLLEASGALAIEAQFVPYVMNAVAEGIAASLKALKKKDGDVAVIFNDQKVNGAFLFGAKIKFVAGDSDDNGSWNTIWSFNEADFEDCTEKYLAHRQEFPVMDILMERMIHNHLRVVSIADMPWTLAMFTFKALKQYLDEYAKEGETVILRSQGKFDATVDVIDGVKVMNFIPDEEITNIAKSDAEI